MLYVVDRSYHAVSYRRRMRLPEDCPLDTPWGRTQSATKIAHGFFFLESPSHGGYWLSSYWCEQIPLAFRRCVDGSHWFEEDSEWLIVAYFFPEFFHNFPRELIEKRIRAEHWQPFEEHFGVEVPAEESPSKTEYLFYKVHQNEWIDVWQFDSPRDNVPEGKIGLAALKGGECLGRYRHFEEYEARVHGRKKLYVLMDKDVYEKNVTKVGQYNRIVLTGLPYEPWANPPR